MGQATDYNTTRRMRSACWINEATNPHSEYVIFIALLSVGGWPAHFEVSLYRRKKTSNVRITRHWSAFVQPLVQWKSNMCYILWMCVCILRYPACNAHAPYCHLHSARIYNIFPHYLINGTIFEKGQWIQNACFDFLYNFFLKYVYELTRCTKFLWLDFIFN